jgi:hypothetical protein
MKFLEVLVHHLNDLPALVGPCSYGGACTVIAPTARWLYVCAQAGCNVCYTCLNRAIRACKKRPTQVLPQRVERKKGPGNLLAVAIQVCLTSSVYCVNIHANMQTNIHTKRVELACCCCDATNFISICISYEELVCLWGHWHMRVVKWNTGERPLTPVHTWNVSTDAPCSGEGETRCELYPSLNLMYPHKTESDVPAQD